VESFSGAELDTFSTASLITRATNDVMQVQVLLAFGVRMICYAPLMGVGGVVMAVRKSVSMSWIIALAALVLLGLVLLVLTAAVPRFQVIQKLVDRLNLVSREELTGLMVIRAFGAEEQEHRRFDAANTELTKVNLFLNRLMSGMMPAIMLLMNGVTVLIVWVGGHRIAASEMPVGDMQAFMQYAIQVIMSFLFVAMAFVFIPRAAVSARRVAEVLDAEPSLRDPETPQAFDPNKRGVVEFQNVSFRYRGAEADALSGVTFTARPGETTALIGSTGSGKSTVAHLILRLYDVTGGSVSVGGADVRAVPQHALRETIGFVPQKGTLLSGTVASNLRYGRPDAPEEDLRRAAEVAQAREFIEEKDGGYGAAVAQGGGNVSGGQRQRLSIARALLKNPDVLIFDDSFSALDFKTDVKLRRALGGAFSAATKIVVAQRVGTILHAEQILVLSEGRIVGRGTHRELLESCPVYYEIASGQLSKEELA
jgi:ATP-binding cassette subfamily B protein